MDAGRVENRMGYAGSTNMDSMRDSNRKNGRADISVSTIDFEKLDGLVSKLKSSPFEMEALLQAQYVTCCSLLDVFAVLAMSVGARVCEAAADKLRSRSPHTVSPSTVTGETEEKGEGSSAVVPSIEIDGGTPVNGSESLGSAPVGAVGMPLGAPGSIPMSVTDSSPSPYPSSNPSTSPSPVPIPVPVNKMSAQERANQMVVAVLLGCANKTLDSGHGSLCFSVGTDGVRGCSGVSLESGSEGEEREEKVSSMSFTLDDLKQSVCDGCMALQASISHDELQGALSSPMSAPLSSSIPPKVSSLSPNSSLVSMAAAAGGIVAVQGADASSREGVEGGGVKIVDEGKMEGRMVVDLEKFTASKTALNYSKDSKDPKDNKETKEKDKEKDTTVNSDKDPTVKALLDHPLSLVAVKVAAVFHLWKQLGNNRRNGKQIDSAQVEDAQRENTNSMKVDAVEVSGVVLEGVVARRDDSDSSDSNGDKDQNIGIINNINNFERRNRDSDDRSDNVDKDRNRGSINSVKQSGNNDYGDQIKGEHIGVIASQLTDNWAAIVFCKMRLTAMSLCRLLDMLLSSQAIGGSEGAGGGKIIDCRNYCCLFIISDAVVSY